jgi:hypothetical protein
VERTDNFDASAQDFDATCPTDARSGSNALASATLCMHRSNGSDANISPLCTPPWMLGEFGHGLMKQSSKNVRESSLGRIWRTKGVSYLEWCNHADLEHQVQLPGTGHTSIIDKQGRSALAPKCLEFHLHS